MNYDSIASRVAHTVISKGRPSDLFGATFFDIRERAKKYKDEQSSKAVGFLKGAIVKDLSEKGISISSIDIKLGKYKGSQFVTSAKVSLSGIKNSEQAEKISQYLSFKYSPKFHLKSFENGLAEYNIR